MNKSLLEKYDRDLSNIDWDDCNSVLNTTLPLFKDVKENLGEFKQQLSRILTNEELLDQCEEYDFLVKIALTHTDKSYRIRLNYFKQGHLIRPHFHRWSYCASILKGSYFHHVYDKFDKDDLSDGLHIISSTLIKEDIPYYINHRPYHSVDATEGTVSLCIRGPKEKDSFVVVDDKMGTSWTQYGYDLESEEEKNAKKISLDFLKQYLERITDII